MAEELKSGWLEGEEERNKTVMTSTISLKSGLVHSASSEF